MLNFDKRYYTQLVKTHGYDFCKDITGTLENFSQDDMRKWLCAYNLSPNMLNVITPENTLVIMGIGVNSEPHIGTISQILRALYFQNRGYNVEIILGDLDSYNARSFQMDKLQMNIEKYKNFIKRLGFDDSIGIIRTQTESKDVMKTAFIIAQQVNDSDFLDVEEDLSDYYKKEKIYDGITFPVKLSILLMFADFIHHGIYDAYEHIIVLSGIDEHTYVPKAATIKDKLGLSFTISGLFSEVIKGFNNKPKMSKSIPHSSILPSMKYTEIEFMLLNSDNNYESYEDSIVYQIMSSMFIYSASQLEILAQHCNANSEEWIADKKKFAISLYRICKAW